MRNSFRFRIEDWATAIFNFTYYAIIASMVVFFWVFLFWGIYKIIGG